MKKIGISLRVGMIGKHNEKRDQINQEWITFLQELEYIPILIPNNLNNLQKYIQDLHLDGIILSGGDNIGDFPDRDETERTILKTSIDSSIPILGICRGMQMINNYFGGNVEEKQGKKHVNNDHRISLTNDFLFSEEKTIIVNSFHNNVIKTELLGKNLVPFAEYEDDNTIEGFTHSIYPIKGVMWHPERKQDINSRNLLKETFG